ncbi:hypothetical protein REJ26_001387 [Providencia stuartii]|uniref:hypothetical protein n=1 Tax=Providencia TaxID=586 RepID=UPI0027F3BC79|nr:hypothetical protein [Providencia sp. 2023EL-00965]ELR5299638.1 hypothetical protein [Providencia stuartii]MDW7588591.1 hypothetical protein [Providencia sp. 2023EL-00965]
MQVKIKVESRPIQPLNKVNTTRNGLADHIKNAKNVAEIDKAPAIFSKMKKIVVRCLNTLINFIAGVHSGREEKTQNHRIDLTTGEAIFGYLTQGKRDNQDIDSLYTQPSKLKSEPIVLSSSRPKYWPNENPIGDIAPPVPIKTKQAYMLPRS